MSSDPRPTVLICDDEPLIVSALARQAKQHGLSFIVDTTSEHVQALARAHQPAVIILDVHQIKDGRDLLARLKDDPATRELKVVMLSGEEDQHVRRTCLELGAADYEVKPPGPIFMRKVARMAGLTAH
jgi:two-component system response regulator AdeR